MRIVLGHEWVGAVACGWYLSLRGPSNRPLFSERNRLGCRVLPLARGWRAVVRRGGFDPRSAREGDGSGRGVGGRGTCYDGPIKAGMVMVSRGAEGEPFRRDLVLGFHPFKEGMIIYEALPCEMRKRLGSGVGEIGLCPEANMRYFARPETAGRTRSPLPHYQDPSLEEAR